MKQESYKKSEDYKRELITIFFAQKRIIYTTTLLIFTFAILIAFFWPPTYKASGSVLLRAKKAEKSPEAKLMQASIITKEDLASELNIIKSKEVVKRTLLYLRENDLYTRTEDTSKLKIALKSFKQRLKLFLIKMKLMPDAKGEFDPINDEIDAIQDSLKLNIIPASLVIKLSLYRKESDEAKVILKALMEQYIVFRTLVFNPKEIGQFYTHQADSFKDKLIEKEVELIDLIKTNKSTDPSREIDSNLVIKQSLLSQFHNIKSDIVKKEQYIEQLNSSINSEEIQMFSFLDKNITINTLSASMADLLVRQGEILKVYHPGSSKAQAIKEQIHELFLSIQNEVRSFRDNQLAELNTLNEELKDIEKRLEIIEERNLELTKQNMEARRLGREIGMLENSYDAFFQRREEDKIYRNIGTGSFFVSVLNEVNASDKPAFPKKKLVIILGLIIGLVTGTSLGFLNEYFEHTFKKPSDVFNYADMETIFSIPSVNFLTVKAREPATVPVNLFITVLLSGAFLMAGIFLVFLGLSQYKMPAEKIKAQTIKYVPSLENFKNMVVKRVLESDINLDLFNLKENIFDNFEEESGDSAVKIETREKTMDNYEDEKRYSVKNNETNKIEVEMATTPEEPYRNVYSVQVGAFLIKERAEKIIRGLISHWPQTCLLEILGSEDRLWYTVQIGDYNDYDTAVGMAEEFTKKERKKVFVNAIDASVVKRRKICSIKTPDIYAQHGTDTKNRE